MPRIFVLLFTILAFTFPALAREEIRVFSSDVVLKADGSVSVTETLEVNAEGDEIRRGIYRDIPVVMLDNEGRKLRPDLDVTNVTRDGRDEMFRLERMGNFQRIWIGNPDVYLDYGVHRYVISYTMTRMARSFPDHDELYWNATGNYWIFPILAARATVTLPDGAVISDLVGYTGVVGSTEQAVSIKQTGDATATFRASRTLGAGEGMTIAVAFQKGVLATPQGLDAFWISLSDLRETLLPILAVLLVLAYNAFAWTAVGRDPAKGTIIPLFHPPKDFSPALTHYVHHWGFAKGGWTAFTAAIFDLGVKGLVTVDNSDNHLVVTATDKTSAAALPAGEAVLFKYFAEHRQVGINKTNGPEIEKQRAAFVGAIEGENRGRWFRRNYFHAVLGLVIGIAAIVMMAVFDVLDPEWLIGAIMAGTFVGAMASAVRGLWGSNMFGKILIAGASILLGLNFLGGGLEILTSLAVNSAALAAFSIVLITVVFFVLMGAPTIQGRKIMDEIDGLKMYLDTAEKNRLNMVAEPPMTIERFERLLPYAIALGVEEPWSEHFEAELARNAVSDAPVGTGYQPVWYRGTSFAPGKIGATVSAAAAGMTAAMVAAQPVQASSSGFSSGGGGGSSGGGGGGGGGGGW